MKTSDIKSMPVKEREKRLQELKLDLVKSRVNAAKSGSSRIRQVKKAIARILTLNNMESNLQAKEKAKSHSNK